MCVRAYLWQTYYVSNEKELPSVIVRLTSMPCYCFCFLSAIAIELAKTFDSRWIWLCQQVNLGENTESRSTTMSTDEWAKVRKLFWAMGRIFNSVPLYRYVSVTDACNIVKRAYSVSVIIADTIGSIAIATASNATDEWPCPSAVCLQCLPRIWAIQIMISYEWKWKVNVIFHLRHSICRMCKARR